MNVARWRPSRGYPGNFVTYPVSDNDFIYMVTDVAYAKFTNVQISLCEQSEP